MQAFLEIFISNTGRSEISKLLAIKKAIKKKNQFQRFLFSIVPNIISYFQYQRYFLFNAQNARFAVRENFEREKSIIPASRSDL